MTFGTCTGNFPSIGHTIFGDLNKFLSADNEVGPFKRFSTPPPCPCPCPDKDDIVAAAEVDDDDNDDVVADSCDDRILLLLLLLLLLILILDDTKVDEDALDDVDGMLALSIVCGVEVEAIGCCLF